MTEPSAQVFLVGAGPGNPGLLTLRAVECLAQADLVLYDRLVPGCLLEFAPDEAELLCVDQLPGCHPERVPGIHHRMIEAARSGLRVVRLKGGDPFVFGRGGEEAEALAEAGVECEIVPGVTAALGAAAYAGLPLTDRRWASAVAFITGHEKEKGQHPRGDEKTERPDSHCFDRFDFFVYFHGAEFGCECRADARGQHDASNERAKFPGESNRDQTRDQTFRAKTLQLIAG